ncbi:MAG TPA: proline-rich domain-containing protein [Pirellulales bacterium]|nr:proline-rich domain-containing protein [Pirellulales bacterium]
MSIAQVTRGLKLPDTLRDQLLAFRRRVWSSKSAEALAVAAFGLLMAYLAVFTLDRLVDTPAGVRGALLTAAIAIAGIVPLYAYRWIWRRHRLPQLARLLTHKHPQIGDQLLGIIELVTDETEQVRSRALCEAAVAQVAREAAQRDFRDAVPNPRHRQWAWAAAGPLLAAIVLLLLVPAAAVNAWQRFAAPWRNTPRYTFAALAAVPDRLVVPHGEPFTFNVRLADGSRWQPAEAVAQYGGQTPLTTTLADGAYRFELPAQIEPGQLTVRVGDAVRRVRVEPTMRPELSAVLASVTLPKYLGRQQPLEKDVRGGSLSVVKASEVSLTATANRDLAEAMVNGDARSPQGATVAGPPLVIDEPREVELRWQDRDGLSASQPFVISIQSRDDEPPSVYCTELPRLKVVIDIETLTFTAKAQDDFGVREVGIEWQGITDEDEPSATTPLHGERVLAAGGYDREQLEAAGTFCPKKLGIEPQPIELRIYVEDYLPGRGRVYSPPFTLYVLNAEQHAAWLAEQLGKWQRHSLEVRDRELQLYETNKELRDLPAEKLDEPDTRQRIDRQATAERANGRRLSGLVTAGEELVAQAARNPEFGVGHLEKWAEMLQILKDISANRMPSVAELLKEASAAPKLAANAKGTGDREQGTGNREQGTGNRGQGTEPSAGSPGPRGRPNDGDLTKNSSPDSASENQDSSDGSKAPRVGEVRAAPQGGDSPPKSDQPPKPPVPQIADVESTQESQKLKEGEQSTPPGGGSPSLSLPVTTLLGGVKGGNESCPAGGKVEEAVRQQEDLLAEFAKVADELSRILANLEGSTFLKRLKAAARKELAVANDLSERASGEFGALSVHITLATRKLLHDLSERQSKLAETVGTIGEDMKAYYERRRLTKFKLVLDEMRELDAIGKLRQIGDDLPKETGLSIAQCEYWSDTLDRWAEDLVDPASGGT